MTRFCPWSGRAGALLSARRHYQARHGCATVPDSDVPSRTRVVPARWPSIAEQRKRAPAIRIRQIKGGKMEN
jgi:hypothetical protein